MFSDSCGMLFLTLGKQSAITKSMNATQNSCAPVLLWCLLIFGGRGGSEAQSQNKQAACGTDAQTFCLFKDSPLCT